jgi:hypothetical protein
MKASIPVALLAVALLGPGCARENSSEPPSQPGAQATPNDRGDNSRPTPPPGGDGTGNGGYSSGGTANLVLSGGSSTLAQLFYNSNPSRPTNVLINLDLNRTSDAVIIAYTENGRIYEAVGGTQHPCATDPNGYNAKVMQYSWMFTTSPFDSISNYFCRPSVQDKSLNRWYTQNGQAVWKGFFQDSYGAYVVVIDRALSQGDGQPAEFVGGRVYFQNFQTSLPSSPVQGNTKMCWQITRGPYDCRTFISGSGIDMTSSLYPNNNGPNAKPWQLLGEFSGLPRAAANLGQ